MKKVEPAVDMHNPKEHLVQKTHFIGCLRKKESKVHHSLTTLQLNINRTLDEELWNLTRLLTIIKCEINAREKCTTAMEQERVGKNVFSSEEPLSTGSFFAGQKSKPLCVFCKKPHFGRI